MKKAILSFGLVLSLQFSAQAETIQGSWTPIQVFSEGTTSAGIMTNPSLAATCTWGILYFDLSSPAGKGQMAMALLAKSTTGKIVRIDYSKNNGICIATGLHIQ